MRITDFCLTAICLNLYRFKLGVLLWKTPKLKNPLGFLSKPFIVKGGDPAALSSTATLLRLHPPH